MGFPQFDSQQIGIGAGPRNSTARVAGAFTFACALLIFPASPGVAAAPQRVVSTNLCADEYVFRLVPRGHIAALSFEAGDRHPLVSTIVDRVKDIPQIRPSTERVLNYRPDLVVMFEGTLPKLRAHLLALGMPVLDVPYDTSLDGVRRTTRMLGARLGAPAVAERLIARMDATLAQARRLAPVPLVRTLIYEPNGYATAGAVSEELMEAAGLRDAAPQYMQTRSGRIPVEAVVAAAPELLIFSGQKHARETHADLVLHHPALAALDGRTYAAWDTLTPLLCAGPWSVDAALTLARLGQKARLLADSRTHH